MIAVHRRLVTIGTGAGYAVLGKGGPAHLVETGDTSFLLDCGEGTAGWLNYLDVLTRIKYVFLSHLHPDHISGLFVMLQNMLLDGRQEPLEIFMPEEGIDPFELMQRTVYLTQEKTAQEMFPVIYRPVTEARLIKRDDFKIRAWYSDHFIADVEMGLPSTRVSYGFTVDAGESRLIYTGDVASVQCFMDELRSGATLLCEGMHIEGALVVRIAQEKGLKQVIFTHIDPADPQNLVEYCAHNQFAHTAKDGMEFIW